MSSSRLAASFAHLKRWKSFIWALAEIAACLLPHFVCWNFSTMPSALIAAATSFGGAARSIFATKSVSLTRLTGITWREASLPTTSTRTRLSSMISTITASSSASGPKLMTHRRPNSTNCLKDIPCKGRAKPPTRLKTERLLHLTFSVDFDVVQTRWPFQGCVTRDRPGRIDKYIEHCQLAPGFNTCWRWINTPLATRAYTRDDFQI